MSLRKLFLMLLGVFAMLPMAHAITFTYLGSTGVSVAATANIGTDGFLFQIPSYFLVGQGTKDASITYMVSADAGYELTSNTLDPNGSVQGDGVVTVTAVHGSQSHVYSETSSPLAQLGSSTALLLEPAQSYTVTLNLSLVNPASTSISKISVMQVFYDQQPVPEPGTMIAIGAGLVGFLSRRKRG